MDRQRTARKPKGHCGDGTRWDHVTKVKEAQTGCNNETELAANVTNVDTLTLEQIDGQVWGDPPADASRLVKTVHGLRRKFIKHLDAEDLRLLLSQQVSPEVLVSRAFDLLEHNPLTEGDYYPGDLLVAVLRLPVDFWQGHPEEAKRMGQVVSTVTSMDLDAHYAPADIIAVAIDGYRT